MTRSTGPTKQTVEVVWERDKGACARCGRSLRFEGRGFEWSVHHRNPRGAGGSKLPWKNQPGNLLVLCGHATTPGSCHEGVEKHRTTAEGDGFIVRTGIRLPTTIPVRHYRYGWVRLLDDGTTEKAEPVTPEVIDPDCRSGKCAACPGWTWNEHLDKPGPCEHPCHLKE